MPPFFNKGWSMSITSAADGSGGIQITTFAKDSTGSASHLGDQSSAASNEIIVPDAITSNNEGNLEASPSYVGRLVVKGYQARGVVSIISIENPGSGYSANDRLQVWQDAGSTRTITGSNEAILNVDSVSAGEVTSLSIVLRGEHVETFNEESNPVLLTSLTGTGSGCKVNLEWDSIEEIRYITADNSNTLTVNEDWVYPPESGQSWAIPYIIEDAATVSGLTLVARTQIYESSRRMTFVGSYSSSSPANNFGGGMSLLNSAGWEFRDTSSFAALTIDTNGVWLDGYLQNNVGAGGGYYYGIQNTDGEDLISLSSTSRLYIRDAQLRSAAASLDILNSYASGIPNLGTIENSKFYDVLQTGRFRGISLKDMRLVGKSSTSDIALIGGDATYENIILASTNGFDSDDDGLQSVYTIKNCFFVGNLRNIRIHDDKIWNVVNPEGWIENSTYISFETFDLNRARLKYSFDLLLSDDNGDPIEKGHCLIYEGMTRKKCPSHNQRLSDTNGEISFDITKSIYFVTTTTLGNHAIRVFKYGKIPFIASLTVDSAIEQSLLLSTDTNISASTPDDALLAASGIVLKKQGRLNYSSQTGNNFVPGNIIIGQSSNTTGTILTNEDFGSSGVLFLDNVVGNFSTGEIVTDNTDPSGASPSSASFESFVYSPFNLIHFDGGTGTPTPARGDVITGQSSSASGLLVELLGAASDGYLLVERKSITDWTNNETIDSNAGGTWAGSADTTGGAQSTNLDFTWLIDGNNITSSTLSKIYDGISMKMGEKLHPYIMISDTSDLNTDYTIAAENDYFNDKAEEEGLSDGDVPIKSITNQIKIYIGAENRFDKIYFDILNNPTSTPTISWEYWNGTGWVSLSVDDQTSNFELDLTRIVSFNIPTGWQKRIVCEATTFNTKYYNAYWIRARMTASATGSININRIWLDKVYEDVHIWGSGLVSQPIEFGSQGYFTSRNPTLGEGVFVANHGAGDVAFWTSDSGSVFTPPEQFTLTLTNLVNATEVRIYESIAGSPGNELAGSESVSNPPGTFQYTYTYTGSDVDIIIVIMHLDYLYKRLFRTLSNANQTIEINQQTDKYYSNP